MSSKSFNVGSARRRFVPACFGVESPYFWTDFGTLLQSGRSGKLDDLLEKNGFRDGT